MAKNKESFLSSFHLIKNKIFIITITIIFIIIFFCVPLLMTQFSSFFYFDSSSAFVGETFGGITEPLICFVAAIFSFFAFYIQYEANIIHIKNYNEQQIENIYFHMLQTLRSIKSELFFQEDGGASLVGKPCLIKAFEKIKNYDKTLNETKIQFENKETFLKNKSQRITQIQAIWEELNKNNKNIINEYFRYIDNIIDFIVRNSKIEQGTKEFYFNQFRSQLSNHETALLFYYSFSCDAIKDTYQSSFRVNLDEYRVLENLSEDGLLFKYDHLLFDKTHFKYLNQGI